MPQRTSTDLTPELLEHMQAIKARAAQEGLDFFEVIFESVDFDTMNQLAAFGGFPVRYPHWRWGMEYEQMRKRDAYGLGRIYEMVINNDPCYAYLQESNALVDQKLVMAHVYGHSDFFKTNLWFSRTDRKMMDRMANHATRVRRHVERHGAETVERFIDVCLSVEGLIDPHAPFVKREAHRNDEAPDDTFSPDRLPAKPYMDPFINPREAMDRQRAAYEKDRADSKGRTPPQPTRDVLLFLLRNAPLDDWQRDVLSIIRDEAYYFAPQGMTKIMNEGWASYWHTRLMTEHFLDDREIIDYADKHSGVVYTPPGGFNPYKLGIELFKDIERRWDRGQHGHEWERLEALGARDAFDDSSGKGREKIFEVRRIHNDVTFLEEFLTDEFIDQHQLFQHRVDPATGQARIVTREPASVRRTLLARITNMGQPFVYCVDANYMNRGELYLAHRFNGLEVDAARAVETLRNLRVLWGRPVHAQLRIEDEQWLFSLDAPDDEPRREKITDSTPEPAHQIE